MEERERYDAKLDHILRVAAGVFAEKGYHLASIRDIAAATGVSLSGLYYYFSSKEELLYLIQRRCFTTLLEHLSEQLQDLTDATDRLRTFVRVHLRFFIANRSEMKVLSHEAAALSGEYRTGVSEVRRAYTGLVHGLVGEMLPEGGVDHRVATFALFGMLNWIYNWYRPDRDVPPDRLADDLCHLFLHGVLKGDVERAAVLPGASPGAGETASIWREK